MTSDNNNGNGNDYLSQEEIDALLNQSGDTNDNDDHSQQTELQLDDYLTPIERDALGEIGNISFGSSATALSTLLGKKVDITTPNVSVIAKEDLDKEFPQPHVSVHVKYVEGFQGTNLLVIKTDDAKVIADLMLGGDGSQLAEELNDIHISAVQEAMNQMMGSAATSMSTIFNRLVNISPPGIDIFDVTKEDGTSGLPEDDVLVTISFRLKIEDLIDSSIMQLLNVSFAKELVEGLIGGQSASSADEVASEPQEQAEEDISAAEVDALAAQQQQPEMPAAQAGESPPPASAPPPAAHAPQAASHAQPPYPPPQQRGYGGTFAQPRDVNVQPVEYPQFSQEGALVDGEVNLNLLMDIPLQVSVELGRTKKKIKEILEFTQGSIIELDKLAGEPVDILVNNKLIAKGEVVVIDENFGVRVLDIVSQVDRLQKLQ